MSGILGRSGGTGVLSSPVFWLKGTAAIVLRFRYREKKARRAQGAGGACQ
jgi:hypothetical protein